MILTYDLNSEESLQRLPEWIEEVAKQKVDKAHMVLVGCKKDLEIKVPTDAVIKFLSENGCLHFETSAKTGEGVQEAFGKIIEESALRKLRQMEGSLIK